jgi:Zn-dependent M28 family amino/carboxypeptidase
LELKGLRARFETQPRHRLLRNVAARLGGASASLTREVVVVGAHYDHIGRFGDQVAARNLGSIHNGADDNASGTAGVLELARCLARDRAAVERSIVFLCFSGEEIGLLGSRAWTQARRRFRVVEDTALTDEAGQKELASLPRGALVDATGARAGARVEVNGAWSPRRGWVEAARLEQVSGPDPLHRVAAMINLDMIGRSKSDGGVKVIGAKSCQAFGPILEAVRARTGARLQLSAEGMGGGGSDHASFLQRQIPALFFFSGMHPEYNTPADDADTLNYDAVIGTLTAVRETVLAVAAASDGLSFDAAAALAHSPHGQQARPKLGVRLDLETGEAGARIDEVLPDSAASRAGLQAGDVILEIGGRRLASAAELPEVVQELPGGEEIAVRFRRGDMELGASVIFPAPRAGFGVSFGSVPDYGFAEKGVRFEAIREGSPAAKAGVRAGDILVQWGAAAVENVEDWTALLGRHKPGDEVTIKLRRGNEQIEVKVKLEARE